VPFQHLRRQQLTGLCAKLAAEHVFRICFTKLQRERRGWLGDAQLSCEFVIHSYDAAAFYTKWLRDVSDSQQVYLPSTGGQIPDCSPFYGHGGLPADPQWSVAFPAITSWAVSYYNDTRLAQRHYAGIKLYVDSEVKQLVNDTLPFARYGDWCSVADGPNTPPSFNRVDISTHAFIKV
jgi:alpha-L-rhamnosidase